MGTDKRGQFHLANLHIADSEKAWKKKETLIARIEDSQGEMPTATESLEDQLQAAWDDVTGAELDAGKVREARREEIEYIKKTNLYTNVPRSNAKSLGKKVITVRWIDINKGDTVDTNYRSRLEAREIKTDIRPD